MIEGLTLYQTFDQTLRDIDELADSYADHGRRAAELKRDWQRELAVKMGSLIAAGTAQSVAPKMAKGDEKVSQLECEYEAQDYMAKAEQMRYSALIRRADFCRDAMRSEAARPSEGGSRWT